MRFEKLGRRLAIAGATVLAAAIGRLEPGARSPAAARAGAFAACAPAARTSPRLSPWLWSPGCEGARQRDP